MKTHANVLRDGIKTAEKIPLVQQSKGARLKYLWEEVKRLPKETPETLAKSLKLQEIAYTDPRTGTKRKIWMGVCDHFDAAIAKRCLALRGGMQRPFTDNKAFQTADLMLQGRFGFIGEFVAFTLEEMFDAQHRCAGVCIADQALPGIKIAVGIVVGITKEDAIWAGVWGKPRRPSDQAAFAQGGEEYRTHLAAVVQKLHAFTHGTAHYRKTETSAVDLADKVLPTFLRSKGQSSEIPDALEIIRACCELKKAPSPKYSLADWCSCWYWVARTVGMKKASAFFKPFLTGIGLQEDDPRLEFRNKVFCNALKHDAWIYEDGRPMYLLRCWNAYATQTKLDLSVPLQMTESGRWIARYTLPEVQKLTV